MGWAAAASLLILSACSSNPKGAQSDWSAEKILSEAREEVAAGAWDKAAVLFDQLEGRSAGTSLAQQAQLEKAYAQYRASDPAQALATLDRFKKLHPASPAMDYALYLQGLVNFNDSLGLLGSLSRQDLSERDQNASKESFEAFRQLSTRFPHSRYTADAQARMAYIVNSLAQYEVHVARHYFNREAYVAAINRAQTAISDYPGVPASEEALYILVRSYDALNMTQLRDDTRRVLEKNYPQSPLLARGFQARSNPWWRLW